MAENTLTERDIDDLAEDALNAACLVIQEKLGVTTGDLASVFFSDDIVRDQLINYINSELSAKEN